MTSQSRPSFLPAAMFLLELAWHNLFEETTAAPGVEPEFRCKGCDEIVPRNQRERHHRHHKRVELARRARETQRARERALAKARQARQRQTEGRLS